MKPIFPGVVCFFVFVFFFSMTAEDLLAKGLAKGNTGDYPGVVADVTKGKEPKREIAEFYYNREISKQNLEDYQGAIDDCTKAIELKLTMPTPTITGSCERIRQDYPGAIADYTKAIELKPDDAATYVNRGNAKKHLQNYHGAIADYTKAIELKPDYAVAYIDRGRVKFDLRTTPDSLMTSPGQSS